MREVQQDDVATKLAWTMRCRRGVQAGRLHQRRRAMVAYPTLRQIENMPTCEAVRRLLDQAHELAKQQAKQDIG